VRLSTVWNWLPAFRATAEAQHLGRAARQLHVSPSALSRTIRLLEEVLEQPLFDRSGKGMRLTPAGEALLCAVREGMRTIEEELTPAAAQSTSIRIVSTGPVTSLYLLPVLEQLNGVVPRLDRRSAAECIEMTLAGELDVAFLHAPVTHPQLVLDRLGEFESAIYCGPGHPLHGSGLLSVEELLEHAFAVPINPPGEPACDNWPADLPRKAGSFVADLSTSLDLVASGRLLGVIPVGVADRLHRLPVDLVPPTQVYALRRPTPPAGDAVLHLIEGMRAAMFRKPEETVRESLMAH